MAISLSLASKIIDYRAQTNFLEAFISYNFETSLFEHLVVKVTLISFLKLFVGSNKSKTILHLVIMSLFFDQGITLINPSRLGSSKCNNLAGYKENNDGLGGLSEPPGYTHVVRNFQTLHVI